MLLHLDTDLGGDPDDACALAMLLGWPGVELVGITTTADPDGQRAGYVTRILRMAGRTEVPVASGAGRSLTTHRLMGGVPDHRRYWGRPSVRARPGELEVALDLLERSIDRGATVVAIGPYTNLAMVEARSGRLAGVPVVAMGGWVRPPEPGLPPWGPETDWNVQCDTLAAQTLAWTADLTLVTLPAACTATLRAAHLPRLAASGSLGAALARQSAAHCEEYHMRDLGRAHARLPDDLVNFHWDPVACAVAAGWSGVRTERMCLQPVLADGMLHFEPDRNGRPTRVVTEVDGDAFVAIWLAAVEAAQRRRWWALGDTRTTALGVAG